MAHAFGVRVAMALEAASAPGVKQGPIIAGAVAIFSGMSILTVRALYKDNGHAARQAEERADIELAKAKSGGKKAHIDGWPALVK